MRRSLIMFVNMYYSTIWYSSAFFTFLNDFVNFVEWSNFYHQFIQMTENLSVHRPDWCDETLNRESNERLDCIHTHKWFLLYSVITLLNDLLPRSFLCCVVILLSLTVYGGVGAWTRRHIALNGIPSDFYLFFMHVRGTQLRILCGWPICAQTKIINGKCRERKIAITL